MFLIAVERNRRNENGSIKSKGNHSVQTST